MLEIIYTELLLLIIIKNNKSEYLDIFNVQLTEFKILKEALLINNSIKTLKINCISIIDEYFNFISLKIDFITDILKVNKSITKIQIRFNEFENIKSFLKVIKNNKTITNLNMECCKLYDEKQHELIVVIKNNKPIEKLNLNLCFKYNKEYQNKIHQKKSYGTRIYSFEEHKEMIKFFKYTYNNIFLYLLQYNTSIKSLKLVDDYRNSIFNEKYDDKYINKIINIIKNNKTLEYLELDMTIPIICNIIIENNRTIMICNFNTVKKLSVVQFEKINN